MPRHRGSRSSVCSEGCRIFRRNSSAAFSHFRVRPRSTSTLSRSVRNGPMSMIFPQRRFTQTRLEIIQKFFRVQSSFTKIIRDLPDRIAYRGLKKIGGKTPICLGMPLEPLIGYFRNGYGRHTAIIIESYGSVNLMYCLNPTPHNAASLLFLLSLAFYFSSLA